MAEGLAPRCSCEGGQGVGVGARLVTSSPYKSRHTRPGASRMHAAPVVNGAQLRPRLPSILLTKPSAWQCRAGCPCMLCISVPAPHQLHRRRTCSRRTQVVRRDASTCGFTASELATSLSSMLARLVSDSSRALA